MPLASLIVTVILVLTTAALGQDGNGPIVVHVTAPVRDGFVDADRAIRDSIKDLQNNLRNKRGLVVAQDQASADITLRVMGRGVVSRRAGAVALPFLSGVVVAPMYANKKVVRVVLEVGEFRKDFIEYEDGYGDCAEEIARQVHAWAEANRGTLMKRRIGAALGFLL
jgi:hypothetical protein